MLSSGRLVNRAAMPTRLAARTNNGGVTRPSTSGNPAVRASADTGRSSSLQSIVRQPRSGSSAVRAVDRMSQVDERAESALPSRSDTKSAWACSSPASPGVSPSPSADGTEPGASLSASADGADARVSPSASGDGDGGISPCSACESTSASSGAGWDCGRNKSRVPTPAVGSSAGIRKARADRGHPAWSCQRLRRLLLRSRLSTWPNPCDTSDHTMPPANDRIVAMGTRKYISDAEVRQRQRHAILVFAT